METGSENTSLPGSGFHIFSPEEYAYKNRKQIVKGLIDTYG